MRGRDQAARARMPRPVPQLPVVQWRVRNARIEKWFLSAFAIRIPARLCQARTIDPRRLEFPLALDRYRQGRQDGTSICSVLVRYPIPATLI